MRLVTTVTWTLEREVDEETFKDWAEDGYTEEQVLKNEEDFMYSDFINGVEERINNIYSSNWHRDKIEMRWEED